MRTLVFQYSNKQQMVITAEGNTELETAISIARENMPEDADCFRIVSGNCRSVWMK